MSTTAPSLSPAPAEIVPAGTIPAWKAELNAKLSARRSRQTSAAVAAPARPGPATSPAARSMAAQVAARVAERYAKAPSYSEVLAARAMAAAEAAQHAVVAAQQAHEAAQSLLTSVADGPEVEELVESAHAAWDSEPEFLAKAAAESVWIAAAATVTHPEPLPARASLPERRSTDGSDCPEPQFLDPRYDPREEATVSPALTVPSKLIEFPRELIAPRKSRPRLAEGPLTAVDETSQLRIFEVGTSGEGGASKEVETWAHESVSDHVGVPAASSPAGMENRSAMRDIHEPALPAEAPDWHSIRLGEHPAQVEPSAYAALPQVNAAHEPHRQEARAQAPLHTASLEDRMMAALVDVSLVGIGFLLFVLMFASATPHLALGKAMWTSATLLLIALSVLYEWLFMSYGTGTPGMRYAQIALCSFSDDNPTRRSMRARVGATLLAVLPLGLGLLWAFFDEDRLGWQDRLTRTYQRSYR